MVQNLFEKTVLNAYKLVGQPITVTETISFCDKCEIEKKM